MAELFTNLARSTLASGITAVATSLTVQSGDGNALFPALGGGDFFTCLLFKKSTGDVEFIKVTARTGDAFTITRAQEQIGNITATAFAFDAGDIVELRPTKGFFDSLTLTDSAIQSGQYLYGGTDTGSANVYAFALSPVVVAYTAGMRVRCKIGATNTGASTLNLNAVAATAIKMEDGTDPPAGAIRSGFTHTFTYDGTNFILQSTGLALTAAAGYNALNKQIKNVVAGTAVSDVATIGGAETHSNKTYISPVINTGVSGTAVLDEDDMTSDSATQLSTQQAVKAYVDSRVSGGEVSSAGTLTVQVGAGGISSARTGVGRYQITHPGGGSYIITVSVNSIAGDVITWSAKLATTFNVSVDSNAGAPIDKGFSFLITHV